MLPIDMLPVTLTSTTMYNVQDARIDTGDHTK